MYVLFKNWTRWSRDAADALVMIRHVRERLGVELCAIEQPIDFDVPEQRPMLGLYVSMPEADNMRRSINIRRGLRQAKREGRWVHQAPAGYRKRYDDRGKVYIEPDPESADLVQDAFRLAATGTMTMDAIRKQVGKNARARGIKWYTSRYWFGEMLRNRAYLGEVFLKAWKDEPAEWIEGQHEALIDQATFAAVQREVARPREGKKSKYVDELPLRGHLLHPETGERLTGSASRGRKKRYWYYHTQPNRAADQDTPVYRVRAEEANAAFAKHLSAVSLAPEVARAFGAVLEEALTEHNQRASDQLRYALSVMTRLRRAWEVLPVEGRHLLAGSIWPDGLIYERGSYRTSPASALL